MKLNKIIICSILMVLFHLVGLYGFLNSDLEVLFIALVPFHLLLMLALLVISTGDYSVNIGIFALVVYLAGFFIEVIGVNSGLIFGTYTYGEALGLKLFSTPLLIGANWLILVYCTGVFLEKFKLKSNFIFSLLGALILLSLDFLIEPIAIRFDYWTWAGGQIPLQNYLGWYIFSFLLFWIFRSLDFQKQNKAAIVLLFAQAGFFLALNIWAF
ncbi:putative membrane protein [Daejeonella rubra]|uniref:Putative membrane protein n=1 Tax=Daejeonella rubra TaxID=990371 RepID=A0A1G9STG6_9SPHI|nr:carotenoid biosynthesis protein [Daejeonella rubra]SDM38710.1 putative membrane protein [Daejeonella rubra]